MYADQRGGKNPYGTIMKIIFISAAHTGRMCHREWRKNSIQGQTAGFWRLWLTEIRETALAGIRHANDRICREMEETVGKRMGSTLAALYIDRGTAVCVNVGDSRIYLLRDGQLSQLSQDHNKARRMVEMGVLTPEQAARHRS